MVMIIAAMFGGAVLFALFGALRPAPPCDHECSACTSVCSRREPQDSP